MTRKLFVKPAVDATIVRQPDRDMRPLDQNGEWVVDNAFWRQRLLHKDVVEAAPPPEPEVADKQSAVDPADA